MNCPYCVHLQLSAHQSVGSWVLSHQIPTSNSYGCHWNIISPVGPRCTCPQALWLSVASKKFQQHPNKRMWCYVHEVGVGDTQGPAHWSCVKILDWQHGAENSRQSKQHKGPDAQTCQKHFWDIERRVCLNGIIKENSRKGLVKEAVRGCPLGPGWTVGEFLAFTL